MYTVTHIYKPEYNTVRQPPGFADFLKGTMSLYYNSNNYNLKVDYSSHPIINFLQNKHSNISESECNELFNVCSKDLLSVVTQLTTNITIATNNHCYTINDDIRNFIRQAFEPTVDFSNFISDVKKQNNLTDYNVLHIRTGDYNINRTLDSINFINSRIDSINTDLDLFVISDNISIKHLIKKQYPRIKYIDTIPVHLGESKASKIEDVRDTLADFFIMSQARNIFAYSVYGGSGFSSLAAEIFDIPYLNIS